jgi:hypothetical protein
MPRETGAADERRTEQSDELLQEVPRRTGQYGRPRQGRFAEGSGLARAAALSSARSAVSNAGQSRCSADGARQGRPTLNVYTQVIDGALRTASEQRPATTHWCTPVPGQIATRDWIPYTARPYYDAHTKVRTSSRRNHGFSSGRFLPMPARTLLPFGGKLGDTPDRRIGMSDEMFLRGSRQSP